tara:strand:+ start:10079 stop:10627 length:549 start_codon:yes stop_codon:yes gene_type:complete
MFNQVYSEEIIMSNIVLKNYSWALKLATKQPSETQQELESKLKDKLESFEKDWQHRSTEYGFDPIHRGYIIQSNDKNKLLDALELAKKSLQPLSFEDAQKQLRVLYSVQARVGENISVEKKAKQMALLLGDIPADLLVYAIKTNAKQQKFWATYAELWDLVVFKLEVRQNLLRTIENKLNNL